MYPLSVLGVLALTIIIERAYRKHAGRPRAFQRQLSSAYWLAQVKFAATFTSPEPL